VNHRMEPESLDDVLEAFMVSIDVLDTATVAEWVGRYPQYEQELTDAAVAWIEMDRLPAARRTHDVDTETLVLRGISIYQNIKHKKRSERAAQSEMMQGIVARANRLGISLDRLAHTLGLSVPLVAKLDRRLIAFERIPDELKDGLAQIVQHTRRTIDAYLRQPPTFASKARHKASHTPILATQQDFFDAIRHDVDLAEDDRQRWLALESSRGEGNSGA